MDIPGSIAQPSSSSQPLPPILSDIELNPTSWNDDRDADESSVQESSAPTAAVNTNSFANNIEALIRMVYAIQLPENKVLFPKTSTKERKRMLRLVWIGHLLALVELVAFFFDLLVVVFLLSSTDGSNNGTFKAIGSVLIFGMVIGWYATHAGGRRIDKGGTYTDVSFSLQERLLGRATADIWTTICYTEFCIFCLEDSPFLLAATFDLLLPDDNIIQTINQYIKYTRVSLGLGVVGYFKCVTIYDMCFSCEPLYMRSLMCAPSPRYGAEQNKKTQITRVMRIFLPLLLAGLIFICLQLNTEIDVRNPKTAFWTSYGAVSFCGLVSLWFLKKDPGRQSMDQIGENVKTIIEKAYVEVQEANYTQSQLSDSGGRLECKSIMNLFAKDMVRRYNQDNKERDRSGLYAKRIRYELVKRITPEPSGVLRTRGLVNTYFIEAANQLRTENADRFLAHGYEDEDRYWTILATDPQLHQIEDRQPHELEYGGIQDVPDWVRYDFEHVAR